MGEVYCVTKEREKFYRLLEYLLSSFDKYAKLFPEPEYNYWLLKREKERIEKRLSLQHTPTKIVRSFAREFKGVVLLEDVLLEGTGVQNGFVFVHSLLLFGNGKFKLLVIDNAEGFGKRIYLNRGKNLAFIVPTDYRALMEKQFENFSGFVRTSLFIPEQVERKETVVSDFFKETFGEVFQDSTENSSSTFRKTVSFVRNIFGRKKCFDLLVRVSVLCDESTFIERDENTWIKGHFVYPSTLDSRILSFSKNHSKAEMKVGEISKEHLKRLLSFMPEYTEENYLAALVPSLPRNVIENIVCDFREYETTKIIVDKSSLQEEEIVQEKTINTGSFQRREIASAKLNRIYSLDFKKLLKECMEKFLKELQTLLPVVCFTKTAINRKNHLLSFV